MTLLEQVGRAAIVQVEDAGALTMQFWSVLRKLPRMLPIVGAGRRWRSAVQQMFAIGASALPMSGAMALCTGFILALQSASELRRFGALEFVVDLVAIGFTRELGPLITALSVSGRSASAISAEIGTMVVTEEIDALRVMGLDPVEFTLAPKYLAALITLPCLTILSTLCGIFAGYLFLALSMDMSLRIYFQAVAEAILLRDVAFMLVKSLVFATIIVHVGCLEGLRVRGGPEAVGHSTTAAVVKSTFLIILADLGPRQSSISWAGVRPHDKFWCGKSRRRRDLDTRRIDVLWRKARAGPGRPGCSPRRNSGFARRKRFRKDHLAEARAGTGETRGRQHHDQRRGHHVAARRPNSARFAGVSVLLFRPERSSIPCPLRITSPCRCAS